MSTEPPSIVAGVEGQDRDCLWYSHPTPLSATAASQMASGKNLPADDDRAFGE